MLESNARHGPAGATAVEVTAEPVLADDAAPAESSPRRAVRARRRGSRGSGVSLWLMALPGLALLFVFAYIPMAGIVIAFQSYSAVGGVFASPWVGLQNFAYLFSTSDAWRITFNTVFMNSLFIAANLVLALTIAIVLNELRGRWAWLSKFYQSVLFLPHFFSYVIVAYFALAFLDPQTGLLNKVLGFFGAAPVEWYSTPGAWPVILTVVSVWKGVGFWVIVYTAGILAISPELYEAAEVDRASKWQQVRHITLPSLTPLVILNVLLSVGGIFRADFGLFYLVTNNSATIYSTTDVIDTYVFRSLVNLGDIGMSSAAGVYQSIVGFVLILIANWLVRRRHADQALF
ncbi:ABC transporter permease [Rugosimonospora africana]|uniref:Sugar ABC transporter permease n=1 Tax=Rugosimonospora africana TaxID=556532 RepID=A0A8J3VUL3_9ACTN|nr:ABC transporter permease subunit [Rugosimonospora africana]GIH19375.1 sugar ABC transporter permease [Rugosimonospora africana]